MLPHVRISILFVAESLTFLQSCLEVIARRLLRSLRTLCKTTFSVECWFIRRSEHDLELLPPLEKSVDGWRYPNETLCRIDEICQATYFFDYDRCRNVLQESTGNDICLVAFECTGVKQVPT